MSASPGRIITAAPSARFGRPVMPEILVGPPSQLHQSDLP